MQNMFPSSKASVPMSPSAQIAAPDVTKIDVWLKHDDDFFACKRGECCPDGVD